jgi:hypothetical protein
MLELQKFLTGGGTLTELTEKYGIKNGRHKQYPNLVLFKYDQIESPMGERICQEARGIILDESDNWRVVGRAYDKFFNFGEGHAAEIDWVTARVQEKVDGSLIMVYEYNGHWNIATTGSADASGEVNGFGYSFAELFARTFTTMVGAKEAEKFPGYPICPSLPEIMDENRDICYLFELMTPFNRVVVPHKESKVTLLAARNRVTGAYVENPRIDGIPNVREFPLGSFEEIMASFANFDGLNQEGYVVVDGNANRVKVKHPQYIALHHLKDNMGPKWIAKVVVSGEVPELLTAFPEYVDEVNKVKEKYEALVAEAEAVYAETRGIESQKDFALAVKDKPYSAILFSLRAGKMDTVKHWLGEEKHFQSVLRLLGIKES